MAVKRIGIVGQHHDADVQQLKTRIEDRGGEALVVDLFMFPSVLRASLSQDSLVYDDIDLRELDAFYVRRLAAIWDLPLERLNQQEWVDLYGKFNDYMDKVRAIHSLKISLMRILCDEKLVINPYPSWAYHHLKLHQYWILKENGFNIPRFSAGNNYFDLKRFAEDRAVVEKPVVTGPVQLVNEKSLDSARDNLRQKPTVYQEYIEGRSIRAFVLGDDVIVACELPRKRWGVDASEQIEYMRRIELPSQIQREVVRAAKTLEMVFSGIDLQYEESSGEYYFLECNNAPYFRPYDTQVNADIGGKLADYLLERS